MIIIFRKRLRNEEDTINKERSHNILKFTHMRFNERETASFVKCHKMCPDESHENTKESLSNLTLLDFIMIIIINKVKN